MTNNCRSCGMPVNKGYRYCSMCSGEPNSGSDDYARQEWERQEQQRQDDMAEDARWNYEPREP